jgi:surface protein
MKSRKRKRGGAKIIVTDKTIRQELAKCVAENRMSDLNQWDVSAVTDMNGLFAGISDLTMVDFSAWNVNKVKNMSRMFAGCVNFNQPLRMFPNNVTNMEAMFQGCSAFNEPLDLFTGQVTNMSAMFQGCSAFNQPIHLRTENVTDMSAMFQGCSHFNQPLDLLTADVINMSAMFQGCSAFDQPLDLLTDDVTDMSAMFQGCSRFNKPLRLDVKSVTNMEAMFQGCELFNQPLEWPWKETKVTNTSAMFQGCSRFNKPLVLDTTFVTDMSRMFQGCSSFNQPLELVTVNVTNMEAMFQGCSNFNRPLGVWNTTKVTNMRDMFRGCSKFNQDLKMWSVNEPRITTDMFTDSPQSVQNMPRVNTPEVETEGIRTIPTNWIREWISIENIVTKEYDYPRILEDPDDRCEKIPIDRCPAEETCEVYKSEKRELCIRKDRRGTFRTGPPIQTKSGKFRIIESKKYGSLYYQMVESETNQTYVLFPTGDVYDVMIEATQSFLNELADRLISTGYSYCLCGHSMGCVLSLNLGLLIHQKNPGYFKSKIVVLGSGPFKWLPPTVDFKDLENVFVFVYCSQYSYPEKQVMVIDGFIVKGNAAYGHYLPYYMMYDEYIGDKPKGIHLHKYDVPYDKQFSRFFSIPTTFKEDQVGRHSWENYHNAFERLFKPSGGKRRRKSRLTYRKYI